VPYLGYEIGIMLALIAVRLQRAMSEQRRNNNNPPAASSRREKNRKNE
jgi:hypothetical protein